MQIVTAERPRDFVRVEGPQAADYLNRMISNDVVALEVGGVCDALLLTAKARVIATLRVLRRGPEDFLLLTEPGLGAVVRDQLLRSRFAARCAIETEVHETAVILGEEVHPSANAVAIPTDDYGLPGFEVLDAGLAPTIGAEELERLRIEAGTPTAGRDVDERVLPAEAGLTERAVSFTKGCYPGQEPVARLHYRGHANRALRVLSIECQRASGGRCGGRLRRKGRRPGHECGSGERRRGRARVRAHEVPEDAVLGVNGAAARMRAPTRP